MNQTATASGTRPRILYHVLALTSVCMWGLTFVSTKQLIGAGLTPVEIFILRFTLAYCLLITFCHDRFRAKSWRDELLLVAAGLSGGSIYFITENTALQLTFASNVALLICTAPIFTLLLTPLMAHTPLRKGMIWGSLLALGGVAMVVMNGSMTFGTNPLGDLLTMAAAILWAVYTILLRMVDKEYTTLFITRKVFFYGLVTAIAYYLCTGEQFEYGLLGRPEVYGNILFLGIVASLLCYIMWNLAVKRLGPEATSNYIYCQPLVSIVASALILGEPLTAIMGIGAACILAGVYLAVR